MTDSDVLLINVSHSATSDKRIINDFSLDIAEGKVFAIIRSQRLWKDHDVETHQRLETAFERRYLCLRAYRRTPINPKSVVSLRSFRPGRYFLACPPGPTSSSGSKSENTQETSVQSGYRQYRKNCILMDCWIETSGIYTLRVLIPHNLKFQYLSRGGILPLSWNSYSALVLEN